MQIAIDQEFQRLIPPLLPEELHQLEANILHDGCQEPLSIWQGLLIDGHNRLKICQQHDKPFKVEEIALPDREHAKLWIAERQLGRRNLSDDQRATVYNDRMEILSDIAQKKKLEKARAIKAGSMETTSVSIGKQQDRTRKTVAKDANLSERKLRYAQAIKKVDLDLYDMVRASKISLIDGKRLAALPAEARGDAIKDVESGTEVRTAIRSAKKTNYRAKIAKTKPKALEGTYRIFYADCPWKYIGLNKGDEYGPRAERHYDCLDDNQLCNYKPGNGSRLVKDMADKDAVLFMWAPSPMLERCFPVIKAWGFEYKGSFVWDKVKHNMGHYNSVRHELLLIATRGSCTPDIPKLLDSVQVIERRGKHSEKPEEFYRIIEEMYDHGRKLELFARTTRDGWDADGNEV